MSGVARWRRLARRAAWIPLLVTVAGCEADRPLPSIVLVTVDTLRADRLGCYGYYRDTSPQIDRLAADGLLFERAYAPMATTLPSHVSLLTSTHPSRHGIVGNLKQLKQPLSDRVGLRTFAQMLDELGYETAAFVASSPLKAGSGIGAGFDHFDQPRRRSRRARAVVAAAMRWLAQRPEGPFFLWVHVWDPHAPYRPPRSVRGAFPVDAAMEEEYLERRGFTAPADPETRRRNRLYDQEVRYVDRALGRLLNRLRGAGLYDDVALVFTADHGEGLGQHDWTGHGRIWNEQLRVPLIVKLPAAMAVRGRRTDPVSLVDVAPTLAQALELPLGEADRRQFDGRFLLARPEPERYVLSERSHRKGLGGGGVRYALTGPRWKYLHRTAGEDELYDLGADPYERRDVLDEHPEVARRLREMLLRRVADHQSRAGDTVESAVDRERLEELRALGYVD